MNQLFKVSQQLKIGSLDPKKKTQDFASTEFIGDKCCSFQMLLQKLSIKSAPGWTAGALYHLHCEK